MSRRKRQKPFFYFEELNVFDKISIGVYAGFTIVFLLLILFGSNQTKQFALVMYFALPQIYIYLFLNESLRNMTSYLIWFCFGLLNLVFYFIFRHNSDLVMYRGNPSLGLLNTFVLLWLYQVLRYVSLKIQHREFLIMSRSGMDFLNGKPVPVSGCDYFIGLIYIASMFGLTALAVM